MITSWRLPSSRLPRAAASRQSDRLHARIASARPAPARSRGILATLCHAKAASGASLSCRRVTTLSVDLGQTPLRSAPQRAEPTATARIASAHALRSARRALVAACRWRLLPTAVMGHGRALADRACSPGHADHGAGAQLPRSAAVDHHADRRSSCSCCWPMPAGGSRESRNPVPSRRSHNTLLEIVWTAVPVLILVIIAIPSFKLLYYMDVEPETELTIKATGHQWYWSYYLSRQRQLHLRRQHDRGRAICSRASCACSRPTTGWCVPVGTNVRIQTTADRRAAQLGGAAVRGQGRRGAGPVERALDQCRASPASTMASAPSCAASTTASCRSRSQAQSKRGVRCLGRARRRPSSPAPTRTSVDGGQRRRRRAAGELRDSSDHGLQHRGRRPRRPHARPAGGAGSIRPTTRTSAPSTSLRVLRRHHRHAACRWCSAPS